jgi:pimeloyl-ACP methyl ester carboxylesterase
MTTKDILDSDCEPKLETAALPLEREWLWTLEWAALRASRVYAGSDVPRGHGEPVIVIPGFLGSVDTLRPLTGWLRRMGFVVHAPGFARNIACPDVLLQRLEGQVASVAKAKGQPVTLIGHSLGGSLARAAAVWAPSKIEQVITLGSPLRSVKAHPLVVETARLLARIAPSRHEAHADHSHGPTCACELSEALAAPFPPAVQRTAIYTRDDGVVDWRTCVDGDSGVDVEVAGTHLGLVVNASVYETIARVFAASTKLPSRLSEPVRERRGG